MLGWYKLTATTSLAEMEWMLARAAGYNAGFAMSTTLPELRQNPTPARCSTPSASGNGPARRRVFVGAARAPEDSALEFHLEPAGKRRVDLYPSTRGAVVHERVERQPGEPTASTWALTNPDEAQPLQFRVQ